MQQITHPSLLKRKAPEVLLFATLLFSVHKMMAFDVLRLIKTIQCSDVHVLKLGILFYQSRVRVPGRKVTFLRP